jgi:NADPH-dependent curcumin reductase CurA
VEVSANYAKLMPSALARGPGRAVGGSAGAGAIGVAYLAAWLGLVEYAQLTSGETLLVTGAGGGVRRRGGEDRRMARRARHPRGSTTALR